MKRSAASDKNQVMVNEKVRAWTSSAAGMRILNDALTNATNTNEQLQAARMVDPQKLRIPLNL